jgi:clorobiocin biosynthesis protein Clo-hal
MRGEAGAFLRLARFFYGNNRAAESWWWEAQRIVNATGAIEVDNRQAFTMATAGFFPTLRAISQDTVVPLVAGVLGIEGDVYNVFHDEGLPQAEALTDFGIETLTPFRLDLRAEPALKEGRPTGHLDVYHDLVPQELDFAHRIAAAPSRIAPAMAPVVDAIARHERVRGLIDEAPSLLPESFAPPEAIRRSALHLVRIAALKGFVRLHSAEGPAS